MDERTIRTRGRDVYAVRITIAGAPCHRRSIELTRGTADQHTATIPIAWRGKLTVALVIPWLLEREYQQHRNLDYYGLPETFEAWRVTASALAEQLSRLTGRRLVKVVIHPGELEEFARRTGLAVSVKVRSDFAEALWRTESAG